MVESNRNFLQEHISQRYNKNLLAVFNSLLRMGGMVEEQLTLALVALKNNDLDKAKQVEGGDRRINEIDMEINDSCVNVIATNQPIATDLRLIVAVIKVVTDLERIGDEVCKLCRVVEITQDKSIKDNFFDELTNLAQAVQKVLTQVLDAFARFDPDSALQVMNNERKVDKEYDTAMRVMVTYMMENPANIKMYIEYGWAARALERIGDHVSNIAEHLVFIIKGKDVRYMRHKQIADLLKDE